MVLLLMPRCSAVFLVGVAGGQQAKDVGFTLAQFDAIGMFSGVAAVPGRAEQFSGDRGVEVGAAIENGPHGADQLLGGGALQQIPGDTGFEQLPQVSLVLMNGEDQDPASRQFGAQDPGDFQAVWIRHRYIEQHGIGPECFGKAQSIEAIACLSGHLEFGIGRHQVPSVRPERSDDRLPSESGRNYRPWDLALVGLSGNWVLMKLEPG